MHSPTFVCETPTAVVISGTTVLGVPWPGQEKDRAYEDGVTGAGVCDHGYESQLAGDVWNGGRLSRLILADGGSDM